GSEHGHADVPQSPGVRADFTELAGGDSRRRHERGVTVGLEAFDAAGQQRPRLELVHTERVEYQLDDALRVVDLDHLRLRPPPPTAPTMPTAREGLPARWPASAARWAIPAPARTTGRSRTRGDSAAAGGDSSRPRRGRPREGCSAATRRRG